MTATVLHSPVSTRTLAADALIALCPAAVFAVGAFGIGVLGSLLLSVVAASAADAAFTSLYKRRLTFPHPFSAVIGLLIALCFPASAPFWLAPAAAAVAALLRGALARTGSPVVPNAAILTVLCSRLLLDGARPMPETAVQTLASDGTLSVFDLLTGGYPSMLGEASVLLLICGGFWLIARRAVPWQLPAAYFASLFLFGWLISALLGHPSPLSALYGLLCGGAVLGGFFLLTDPLSAPVYPVARMVSGALAGLLTAVIRLFSCEAGALIALLAVSVLSPLADRFLRPVSFGGAAKKAEETDSQKK